MSRYDQTIQPKHDIPIQRKNTSKERMHKDIPTTGCQGNKTILEQNIASKRT